MNPLRERAFARLWVASLFAETAEWMLQVALPVFIFTATGSASSTAVTMVAGLVPMVLVSPVAGVLADRWNRRVLLAAVCFTQAAVSLPLLAVGEGRLTVVYLVMVAQSMVASVYEPTRSALVPALVGEDRLTAANGLMGMNSSVARLAGASLGGAVLGFAGLGWVVGVYLSLLVVAGLMLVPKFAQQQGKPGGEPGPLWRAWLDGLADIRRDRRLRTVWWALVPLSVGQGMFAVLFVVFVTRTLGGGEAEVGLLRGVQAIGGLAAGLCLASLARRARPAKLLGWGIVAFGVCAAVIWNAVYVSTSFPVYVVLFIVVGVPAVMLNAGLVSVVQLAAPPERAGRALSSMFAGAAVCQVAGTLGAGAAVGWASPAVLLNAQAVFSVVAAFVVLLGLRTRSVTNVEACPVSSPPVTST
ncbi:MFS transporter [Amycolatopsis taiwanensis]|uniref:MFS transporter n=1 Tax=Amycolatopsis taiwanensis TaxID=342230 RepID=UPI0004B0324D|nr:MFS transporter [Amycolatopsis taiwanensis]